MLSDEYWHICVNKDRTKVVEYSTLSCNMCKSENSFDFPKNLVDEIYVKLTKGDKFHKIHEYYQARIRSQREEFEKEIKNLKEKNETL